MTGELACWLELIVDRPDVELVVVASRGKLLLVEGPFEAAYLLLMTLKAAEEVVLLSQIPLQDALVLGARAKDVAAPSNSANSSLVTLEHS